MLCSSCHQPIPPGKEIQMSGGGDFLGEEEAVKQFAKNVLSKKSKTKKFW